MSHAVLTLYADNDNLFRVEGLKDERNDDWADGTWTVEVTLLHPDGEQVAGQVWPETLDYVSGSDGDFVGDLEDALEVDPGDRVIAKLEVTSNLGFTARWKRPVKVEEREF